MIERKLPDRPLTTRSWAAATSLGLGLAFLSFIPGMLVMDLFLPTGLTNMGSSAMPEALDPEALPAWLDLQTYRSWYRMHLGYHVVALAVFGSILGWSQSRLLREHVPASPWVAATAMGFVAVLCFEIVEPHIVVGPHAGSFEPLMISIGGSTIAGLAQWWVLRRRGVLAMRWLALWIAGAVVGVGAAVAAIIGLEGVVSLVVPTFEPTSVVAQAVAWGTMLLILGSITGAVAGSMSARALSSALAAMPSDGSRP
jgi:hypothetical protein